MSERGRRGGRGKVRKKMKKNATDTPKKACPSRLVNVSERGRGRGRGEVMKKMKKCDRHAK